MKKTVKIALCAILLGTSISSCIKKESTPTAPEEMSFETAEAKFGLTKPYSNYARTKIIAKYGTVQAFYDFAIKQRAYIAKMTKVRTGDPYWSTITFNNPLDNTYTKLEISSDELILDALMNAGIDAPKCEMAGASSACAGFVQSGSVSQDMQSFLDDDQIAAGFAILCAAQPTSDAQIVLFQEESLY